MHKYDREVLISAIWVSARNVGLRPPHIANDIIEYLYPATHAAANAEGVTSIFRDGLIKIIKKIIRMKPDDKRQGTFADMDPHFYPIVATLKSGAYHVPYMDAYMTVGDLINDVPALDAARQYMRKKARDNANEADALDSLYHAVQARNTANDNIPVSPAIAA